MGHASDIRRCDWVHDLVRVNGNPLFGHSPLPVATNNVTDTLADGTPGSGVAKAWLQRITGDKIVI